VKVINRYIAREVLKGSFVAALVLVTLVNFFTFSDELRALGKGQYSLTHIFEYLALLTPRNLYELIPSAALLGTMFTVGAMGNNRELIAMRAAGVSLNRIAWAVLRAGLVLVMIAILVGEVIAPKAEQLAIELKATAQYQQVASWSHYGFWVRDGNTFVNIRRIVHKEELGDISIYEMDQDQQMRLARHAEKAVYVDGEWRLETIHESRFEPERVTAQSKPSMAWRSIIDPDLMNIALVNPNNLSIYELVTYIQFLRENDQKSNRFELAFWSRIINPLVTLVMLLIATPFVLNVQRSVSVGQRIITGVVIGLSFILFEKIFAHLGLVYDLPPLFAAAFPSVLFFVVALIAIRRLN
jgi:lipopolysaccharide export system permease protein